MANKIHHCFNCGEETEDYDEMPNGSKLWCCGRSECAKELRLTASEIEAEARDRAEQDNYRQYY